MNSVLLLARRPAKSLLLRQVPRGLPVLRRVAAASAVCLWASVVPTAFAQAPAAATAPAAGDLNAVFQAGMEAFGKGDFETAAKQMQAVLDRAGADSPLEPVYYTLGAAQFNLKNFPAAIDALEKYRKNYPQADRVNEAALFIGQAQIQMKDYAAAAATLAPLERIPEFRDQALLTLGMAQKDAGNPDAAIAALEKLTAGGIRSASAATAAMALATIYSEKGQSEAAIKLLQMIRAKTDLLDDVIRMNAMAIEQGDTLLQQEKAEEALRSYRLVQSRDEILRLQRQRIAALQARVEQDLVAVKANPQRAAQIVPELERLRKTIADIEKQIAEFEKTPDFEGPFWLRVARAYYGMGRKWEAIAIYDELLRRQPQGPEREPALFQLTLTSAEVERAEQTRKLAEAYQKEFPNSANANTIGYLMGATALQSGDTEAAINYFGQMLASASTDNQYREEISFLLANARFSLGEFKKAAEDYRKYLTGYPSGKHAEEATYRAALCALFDGEFEKASKEIAAYVSAYPAGFFLADAKYRLEVCRYATGDYEAVLTGADAWLKEFPTDPLRAEVLALKADALAGIEGREPEAIDVYLESVKVAHSDEVLNHSLFEAAKIMQQRGQWERIGSVFRDFVTENPSSATVVPAAYWIGRAKAKEGKPEEAKQIIADVIKKNLDDPTQAAVEQLLTQLAQLSARRAPGEKADESADPGAELDALLGAGAGNSPTAQARILFAKSELARLKKNAAEQAENLAAIAEIKPEALSPFLLAQTGDYALAKKDFARANLLFQRLQSEYPRSEYLDYAYNGFGEISFAQGKYAEALRFFTDAVDKAGATQKLKDVNVGQAKSLLALGRLDEAEKLFKYIGGMREWRGDATAFSVYSLGEIEEKRGKLAEAIAHYQRVYVAYGRFLPWVAKAYVRSAECFQKLGKTQEAANTYREMLRNEKLAGFSETKTARKNLEALGNG